MRRCPGVFCLGERRQRCLWFCWILLPGSVPSWYTFSPLLIHDYSTHDWIEGKYSHAAVWHLSAGYELPNNTRHYPLSAMVANLAKPTPEKPALMTHDDVVTFFHEMGHVFHGLLSKTKYSRFHGTKLVFSFVLSFFNCFIEIFIRVARDFVEAPSQMLENWYFSPFVFVIFLILFLY